MPNVFDQFDAAPPGVVPQTEAAPQGVPSRGNIFDQFNADPVTGEVRGSTPPPAAPSPTMAERVKTAAPSLYTSIYENPMLGAEQKTAPQPERYGKPLSTDLFASDAGEVSFRDPSGAIIPTDRSKHAILAGPDGRLAVYQRSGDTAESPVVGASRVLSMGLGSNAPTTARAVAATAPAVEASIPKLKEAATAVYESPEILARSVHPGEVATAFQEISPQLRNFDPKITARLSNEIGDLGSPQGGLTVKDLNIASDRLGVIANETQMTGGGPKATPDAAAATIVKKKIDGLIRQVAPEWAEADKNYSAAEAARTIINREDKATILARGGDIGARMQTQATQLLLQPKYLRGFTPEEITQLQNISEGKIAGDRVRQVNSWLTGKIAALGPIAAGFAGYQHAGGLGAAVGMLGTAAVEGVVSGALTRLSNNLSANQINTLSQTIRARSPLGQQLAQNAKDWEAAWKEMQSTPSSMTLTTLARSSRDLANALRSAGVEVGPAQLMRGAKPDENQQNIPRPPRQ